MAFAETTTTKMKGVAVVGYIEKINASTNSVNVCMSHLQSVDEANPQKTKVVVVAFDDLVHINLSLQTKCSNSFDNKKSKDENDDEDKRPPHDDENCGRIAEVARHDWSSSEFQYRIALHIHHIVFDDGDPSPVGPIHDSRRQ